MSKKTFIFGVLILAVIVAAAAVYFISKRGPALQVMDGSGSSLPYPELQGEWTEVGTDSPVSFTIEDDKCRYTKDGEEVETPFTVSEDEDNNMNQENTEYVEFDEGGPEYCYEFLFHTQQTEDGHTIRIMDSLMFEDDGVGWFVYCEFVHSDDLQYVEEDFTSDLYKKLELSDREATPTYLEVEEEED